MDKSVNLLSLQTTPAGEEPVGAKRRSHRVIEELRELIVTGQLEPGERLIEQRLGDRFETSRGSVRAALALLEREGLVSSAPYKGAVVLGVSEEEVHQVLIPIRLVLERFSFAKALQVMTDADLAELAKEVWIMERAAAAADLRAHVEADLRFHEFVIAHSGLPYTLQTWQSITPRVRAYFHRHARYRDLPSILEKHRELLEALTTRNEKRVLATLEEHIALSAVRRPPHQTPTRQL
jgi:DNA-binding GntR family transcriptional regulator